MDGDFVTFDVFTADHDDVKGPGGYRTRWSRVVLSTADFPTFGLAQDMAAALAVCVHGGMAVSVMPRY